MRLLVIGTGSIGERHLRVFQRLDRCDAIAFCETQPSRRTEIARRYGIPEAFAYADLESALSKGTYDIAVIATPAPTHLGIGIQLADLGIHQLMEKPLSLSLDGVESYARTVAARNLTVAVGYVHRAHPAVTAIRREITSGRFGKVLAVSISSGQSFAQIRPAYRDVYFARPESGGGAINDMITHLYNVGDWFAGPISRLVTDAAHQALEGVAVEDTVNTLTRHESGAMGSYTLNLYQHPNEVLMTVVCERGTLRADYPNQRWSWMTDRNGAWLHEPVHLPDRDTIYQIQNAAFLDAVEGFGEVICPLEDAIRTLKVNLASHRSAAGSGWENVLT
jgi:predicted dehydrogenase